MRKPTLLLKLVAINAGLLLTPIAHAGLLQSTINVRWEANSTAIPALGSWGLATAALLLAVIAWRTLKASPQAKHFMHVLLLGGGVLFAYEASTEIMIAPPLGIFDDDCAGGNLDYVSDPTQTLANTCTNAVRIIEYQYPQPLPDCVTVVESCPEGTLLEAETGICTLNHYDFTGCDS